MWETLSPAWQAAFELAWEAYCSGTIPIGAVVADADGVIHARGRNRIRDGSAPAGQVFQNELAHAELNALLSLSLSYEECKKVALYTTMEPCPLCMGALYMSDVKALHFAAHDPWAGSTDLLGTTPYLSRKPIRVTGPQDTVLQDLLVAMQIEYELQRYGEKILSHSFIEKFQARLPNAVDRGVALFRSGTLRQKMGENAAPVLNWLANQVQ